MKKTTLRFWSLLLALCMMATLFAGCQGNKAPEDTTADTADTTAPVDDTTAPADTSAPSESTGNDTLVYATATFGQKFSPFFYETAYDGELVDLVTGYLLTSDREGNIVHNGIEGETIPYNGTDYFYNSIGSVEVVENADGSVDYNLTMRDDIVFSDGVPADIDDVIFGIYVLCDPTYDGPSTLYAMPIEGVAEYYNSMAYKGDLILAAGRDGSDFTNFTEEEAATYWAAFDAAGSEFVQGIVDYLVEALALTDNGDETYTDAEGNTLSVADIAPNWGFTLDEGATIADWFQAIAEAYGYSVADMEAEAGYSDSLANLIDAQLGDAAANYHTLVAVSDVPNIPGVIRTGDYSLTIHCTSFDATSIYNMGFSVAPLHYYGDESQYDYENNSFGFPKGDLSMVKAKTTQPLGCGPYVFQSYENGVATLTANPYYFKGEPKIKNLLMQESEDSNYIPGINTGTFDLAVPSISNDAIAALQDANSNGEITGDKMTTILIDYRGYGYLGINADLVNVGGAAGSQESKDLRLALMTVLSVYRDSVINSYYGDRASVIQYPISNTSWAAPRPTDEGYQNCYSTDVDGNPIYTDDMNEDQKYAAALEAAKGFLIAAGYTFDEASDKFTAAPDGASMTYEILIPGQGTQDHPAYGIAVNASEALAKIGIELKVNDVGTAVWNDALNGNTAELWVAAWQSTADPDMYQVYYSANAHGNGTNSNHYQIDDADLDAMILDARTSPDNTYRKSVYKQCLELILGWGCELPLYQRKDGTVVSTERVNVATMPQDMTPYWGWAAEIENLEMN